MLQLAAVGLRILLGTETALESTVSQNALGPSIGLKVVITLFLVFVIRAVATDAHVEGNVAGPAIGTTLAVAALGGRPLTGASMNPTRCLRPAPLNGPLDSLWFHLLALIVGAGAGAWACRQVACTLPGKDASGCC